MDASAGGVCGTSRYAHFRLRTATSVAACFELLRNTQDYGTYQECCLGNLRKRVSFLVWLRGKRGGVLSPTRN